MTARVIAWPPVGAIGTEWTEVAPVQVSRSMVTGAERVSAFQRKRRMASLVVPGIGRNTYDGGYIEMLKRYLEGVHLVRLYSYPVAWHMDRPQRTMLRGNVYTHQGQTYVEISGLPPSRTVCRPGDFITLFLPGGTTQSGELTWETGDNPFTWLTSVGTNADTLTWYHGAANSGTTVQVTRPAESDDMGRARVAVFESVADYTQVYLLFGACDTGAFRPMSYPRAVQPQQGSWTYEWQFREVFADEVGGFQEVNPWAP